MKKLQFLFLPPVVLVAGCTDKGLDDHSEKEQFCRLVKSIEWTYLDLENNANDEKAVFHFKYDDDNRVTYVTEKMYDSEGNIWGDNVYRYSYSPNELIIIGEMNEERYDEMTRFAVTYTYEFQDSRVVSEVWTQSWANYSATREFHYDSQKRLCRIISDGLWGENDTLISWQDGNIVGAYEYGNQKNNANIDFEQFLWNLGFDPTSDRNVFRGIHSADLIKAERYDDYVMVFLYEFDDYKAPIKIECADGLNSISLSIKYY